MPEEEMYVASARARMPMPSRPRSHPATAPGTAFSTKSTMAEGTCRRRLAVNSVRENLQAECEQEQDDSDARSDLHELSGRGHGGDASLTDGQTGEQGRGRG
ncbi:hypothetical protein GCM10018780_87800 [Streptomyces lanatus]|nr:hypothetical protein GCM10018780_87800 [Streptomyces lanatus]